MISCKEKIFFYDNKINLFNISYYNDIISLYLRDI